MSATHCLVKNCAITLYNKPPGVSLFSCPQSLQLRNRWLKILKHCCSSIDWNRSKICSRHFEQKFIDGQRKLKDNAVPSIFTPWRGSKDNAVPSISTACRGESPARTKVDRLLSRLSQSELQADIKSSLASLKEPSNLDVFVRDDLKCKPDAPMEAKLWLMVKKQDNLNTRLINMLTQTKKHEKNDLEELRTAKKEQEQTIESMKYIVKCLQEKQATLEEQIEILTAVETR